MLLANLARIDTISHILSTRFVGQPGLSGVKLILNALLQSRRWTGSGHGTGGLADCGGHGGAHALSDCVRSRPAALSSPTPRSGREYALMAEQLLYRGPAMG